MRNREWGPNEQDRDEQWIRDERWRRDMGRDFSRLEMSPYEREMRDRELRDREMREMQLRDRDLWRERELRGDFRHSFGDRDFRGGAFGAYRERGFGMYHDRPMGRAPKGYQRSDERIKEDVCDRLMHSWVDAENVEIEVRSGEVILSGTVDERHFKRVIEDVAEQVLGVKDVQNNIRVQPRGDDQQQQQRTGKKPTA